MSIAFALWTVCCHAIVFLGGGLTELVYLGATVLLLLGAWVFVRRGSPAADPAGSGVGSEGVSRRRRAFGATAIAGALTGMAMVHFGAGAAAVWAWCILVLAAGAVLVLPTRPALPTPARSRGLELGLWGLALGCLVVTLVSHRPDPDDAFYVNVSLAAVEFPERPLLKADTLHGIEGLPIHLPVYRAHAYELMNAAISYLTGIAPLYVFHWLAAATAALFVPLAHARLFRLLTPERWIWTTTALVIVLLAAGEPHHWYGNFAFVRIWQGKAINLMVFTPLIYFYALRFALRPGLRAWALLTAAQIAALGCTASAVWTAPLGALLGLCCATPLSRAGLGRLCLGVSSSLYVLAVGWVLRGGMQPFRPEGAGGFGAETTTAGSDLLAAFVNVLGDSPLLGISLLAVVVAWGLVPTGLGRRFAIVLPLATGLLLFNPWAAAWVKANVTGPSYWRSLWALPIPILLALVLVAPLHWFRRWGRSGEWLTIGSLVAFATLIPSVGGLSEENRVRLGAPALKVDRVPFEIAREVVARVEPDSHVLVPTSVGSWIPTSTARVYPLAVRHYLRMPQNRDEERERLRMREIANGRGRGAESRAFFESGLRRFDVAAVCFRIRPSAKLVRESLRSVGFEPSISASGFEVWIRPQPLVPDPGSTALGDRSGQDAPE